MPRMPGVTQAPLPRGWTRGGAAKRLIVIHYTAGSESPTAAEDGAAYDQRRTDGTSTHFFTDRNSIVQEIDTADRAHAALYNGNQYGIHIEMCGTNQTRAQWLDEGSRTMITNTARVCAWAMKTHGIPLVRLIGSQVRGSARGICGHVDITNGYPEDGGTHTDPGPNFPWDVLSDDIRKIMSGDDDDMALDEQLSPTLPGTTVRAAILELFLSRGKRGAIDATLDAVRGDAADEAARDAADRVRDAELLAAVRADGGQVNVPKLAAELAARLTPIQAAELAKAVVNEQYRRLES